MQRPRHVPSATDRGGQGPTEGMVRDAPALAPSGTSPRCRSETSVGLAPARASLLQKRYLGAYWYDE
eukprot:6060417-Alexandrium_andersonii.AAC.1